MKKSWLCTLFSLAMLSVGAAATMLFPVVVGGRWGFVNQSGETVINPQFDRAEVFAEGLAPVKMGRWGYVDPAGKVAINPQFDRADQFSEGLAAVKLGGGPGAFDNPRPWSPFHVPALIEFLSGSTTLLPGTVILTGTPHGVGMARKPQRWLKAGDSVSIEIEKIGALTNPVASESA